MQLGFKDRLADAFLVALIKQSESVIFKTASYKTARFACDLSVPPWRIRCQCRGGAFTKRHSQVSPEAPGHGPQLKNLQVQRHSAISQYYQTTIKVHADVQKNPYCSGSFIVVFLQALFHADMV